MQSDPPATPARSTTALAAIGWALACLCLALEACLWIDLAGDGQLGDQGPAAAVDRPALHAAIQATVRGGATPPELLSADEASHLVDVQRLVVVARWLGAAGLLLVLATWRHAGRRGLRDGGLVLLGGSLGLALVTADWPVFFRSAHPLLFGAGRWDFDPGRHLLPALYTPSYFALRLLPALLPMAALALAAWHFGRSPDAPWSRPRAHDARWVLLALPMLALAIPAGLRLDLPWSWGHLVWIATLTLAMIAGAALLLLRGRLPALILLGTAAAGVVGIALGVRAADLRARSATIAAAPMVAQLDAALAADRLPPGLDAELRASLPPPPPGFGDWYLSPIRDGYLLGFRGPLAWHYEYHSRRGTWNLPRYGP